MAEQSISNQYLTECVASFRSAKSLTDKAIAQTRDEELFIQLDEESNSVAIVMKHLAGNMLSRWTDFLTTDGEKADRNRDDEFVIGADTTRSDLVDYWERGWKCLFGSR